MISRLTTVVLAAAMVACMPSDAPLLEVSEAPSTSTRATTSSTDLAPATDGPELEDPTPYLVEMANQAADIVLQLSAHEQRVNERHANMSTEEDQLSYLEDYWGGTFSLYLEGARSFDRIVPPEAFVDAHREYVASYRALYEELLNETESFHTLTEWSEFMANMSVASDAMLDLVAACEQLVETASLAGYSLDLGCPTAPPEVVHVEVSVGPSWEASPDLVPVGDVVVELAISNTGDVPIPVVVLDIFDGDPLDLPSASGLIDLSLSGVFDTSSDHASFGVAYPDVFTGEDSQLRDEVPELQPGETVTVTVWGEGPIVVFDYSESQFEAGARVVIERIPGQR